MKLVQLLITIKIFKRIIPSLVKRFLKIINKSILIIKFKKIVLEININEPMDQLIFFHNNYEDKQINYLINKIKKFNPSIFLDIGCNSGLYSLIIAKNFPKLKILSFEPVQETFLKFKKNIKLNKKIKNIKPYNFGLSSKNRDLILQAKIRDGYIQQGGAGIIRKDTKVPLNHLNKSLATLLATFKKGDDTIKFKNKIITCKIDVEGHELDVLKGMINILKKNKLILQIEIFDSEYKKVNSFLKKNNYHQINKIFSDGKIDYYFKNF